MANKMKLLEFENQVFLDIFQEDGLVIMAKGLGIERLLLSLLKVYQDPGNLVLIIGTSPQEEAYFIENLEAMEVTAPKVITSEYNANDRHDVYMAGGVLFVTSRILVVDMLMDRVPIELITGILVYKAHRILDSCQEAFILRLYRTKNKKGFIKALSSNPCAFTRGFCQIQRVMRNLFVRKLYLWPRFHAVVSSTFENHKPEVIELHISMTQPMQTIQLALLDLMNVCVKELKKLNKTLDTDEVTVENAISKSFDKIIKYQLDPIWHQLSSKSHRLISDLRTLRTILIYLTQYDCVTFYNLLKSIKENIQVNAQMSDWLFLDVAENMFVQTKERLFGRNNAKKQKLEFGKIEPCLEENPKWLVLSEVLAEIHEETKENSNPAVVLVLTDDDHTHSQVKEFLCEGSQTLLMKLYNKTVKNKLGEKNDADGIKSPGTSKKRSSHPSKRKRAEGGSIDKESDVTEDETKQNPDEAQNKEDSGVEKGSKLSLPTTIIQSLHGNNDPFCLQKILQQEEPKYVVLYDTDMQAIRQLEVYQALHPEFTLKVYFLIYGGSAEEQRYLTTLRKEKEAFEYLIKEKSIMAIPEDIDGKSDDHPDLIRNATPANETVNSRKAGGQQKQQVQHKIIVDLREFRSELPPLIHRRGIDVEPMTLEVGDYILTPDICVERKSLNDLIGSLNSGRLYNQVQAMCRYYKRPVLLIEFDENKSFSLQGKYYLSTEVSSHTISAKLILLTIHFPSLRILWCPSPYATAEMFEILKYGKEQPDAEEVSKVTSQETIGKVASDKYMPAPQDFLSRMPGINSKNIWSIMNKVESIAALVDLSEEQLAEIFNNKATAKVLYEAIHNSPKDESKQFNMNPKRTRKK